jgi:anti-anti-sigma factor
MTEHEWRMFRATVVRKDGQVVVVASGEIDNSSISMFKSKVDEALSLSPQIIIDLEAVSFMDSAGLRLIIQTRKRCGDLPLTIRGASTAVLRTLELTGLLPILVIEPHRGTAG